MAIIRCKECNKKISSSASICPKCGYSNQSKKSGYGCFIPCILIIIFFAAIGQALKNNTPQLPRTQTHQATSQQDSKSPIVKARKCSAVLVAVRTKPFTTTSGKDTTMVYVDWKNNGTTPVRIVDAVINAYDSDGNSIEVAPGNYYCIYAVSRLRSGILPGETYIEPDGDGYLIPQHLSNTVKRVVVEIKSVEEDGI